MYLSVIIGYISKISGILTNINLAVRYYVYIISDTSKSDTIFQMYWFYILGMSNGKETIRWLNMKETYSLFPYNYGEHERKSKQFHYIDQVYTTTYQPVATCYNYWIVWLASSTT